MTEEEVEKDGWINLKLRKKLLTAFFFHHSVTQFFNDVEESREKYLSIWKGTKIKFIFL